MLSTGPEVGAGTFDSHLERSAVTVQFDLQLDVVKHKTASLLCRIPD